MKIDGLAGARPRRARASLDRRLTGAVRTAYERASVPVLALFLLHNRRIHRSYRLTWRRKLGLAVQFHRNTRAVRTGTSYRAHVAMAAKILEISPEVEG